MTFMEKLLEKAGLGGKTVSLAPEDKIDVDLLRTDLLKKVSAHTGRNVIAYYSGMLEGRKGDPFIEETDMFGFMEVVPELDRTKGLDLILHTPGGIPTAAESIIRYLHAEFGDDIRVIVPGIALSAGTIMSCSAKEILMGNYACLGPIAPQYRAMPAFDMRQEMYAAKKDLKKNPETRTFWSYRLRELPPGYYYKLQDAITFSGILAEEFLTNYMFKDDLDAKEKAERIVKKLNSNNGSHSRPFGINDCQDLGFHVTSLSQDAKLEDIILSLHGIYSVIFSRTRTCKIIENHHGTRYLCAENRKEDIMNKKNYFFKEDLLDFLSEHGLSADALLEEGNDTGYSQYIDPEHAEKKITFISRTLLPDESEEDEKE